MSTPGWLGNVVALLMMAGIVGFCLWYLWGNADRSGK